MRIASVTPMKNEAPFVLEWVAYHRLIGVTDMTVFTNNCEDGTDVLLDRLDDIGVLRHLPNPAFLLKDQGKFHWQAIRYVNKMARFRDADWRVSFDADEFVNVHAGQGRLTDLFEAVPHAQVIAMNQVNFGSDDDPGLDERLQIERFTRSAPLDQVAGRPRRGVKCLTRADAAPRKIGNHTPAFRPGDAAGVVYVNGSGARLDSDLLERRVKGFDLKDAGHDLVQLNHYAVRSLDSYLVKTARGNANHAGLKGHAHDLHYWGLYDHRHREDRSITRWAGKVRDQVAEWLTDPALAEVQAKAMNWHRAKAEEQRARPEVQAMIAELTGRKAA